ncbi:MAG: diaminopimelate decarboxylase [Candidatus Omnitrophota bacterium]|nr:MAG: diaminopimelate decarboxylase [Candidatus Omnitrophota bacterium]
MHRFKYKDGSLYCENVNVARIAKEVGTPLYIYSKNTLLDHYRKIRNALREVSPLICFSVKSNSNLAVLKTLVAAGAGLDIVSGGELYRAKLVKADPGKIVYAGVGKKRDEIMDAIRYGIFFFNVESDEELALINTCAGEMKRKVNVAVRINPDVRVLTHDYITTGMGGTKFGVDFKRARAIFRSSWKYRNTRIRGVHIHIGSQILGARPFQNAIKKVLKFLEANKIVVEYLNIGGGLGIVYSLEKPQTASRFAKDILPLVRKSKLKLILEPGRFISGNSGIMVTKVLFRKRTGQKNFIIVDSGMNDFVRPSLYEAYHTIAPVTKPQGRVKKRRYDIVGPICESGDFLAKNRTLPAVAQGSLLAVMGAGAYGYTMSSNYNSRPRAPEVMVDKKRFFVVKKREAYKDLVEGEAY